MKYLITGGTGTFGTAFTERNVDDHITCYSRDEHKQLEQGIADRYIIGDVRDKRNIRSACEGIDVVIHAAALKHVQTGQDHPWEVIQTNVMGTRNVCEAAKHNGCKLVFLSTDKAVNPINTYGKTKALAEDIVLSYGFSVVRYGNVWGSRGSVVHRFKEQEKKGKFAITDTRMSRFILTVDYAVELVLEAVEYLGDVTLVSKAKSLSIYELAKAIDPAAEISEVGIRPGEKLYEHLMTGYERARAVDKEWYYLLLPDTGGKMPVDLVGYDSSENKYLNDEEIQELIDGAV